MIRVKPGVLFGPEGDPPIIAPAGYLILEALKDASVTLGVDLTITSAWDGVHSGPQDPHKLGEAYDIRSQDLDPVSRGRLLDVVMEELGWQRFFGFLEAHGTPNEHFHFQRARNTTFTVEDFLVFKGTLT